MAVSLFNGQVISRYNKALAEGNKPVTGDVMKQLVKIIRFGHEMEAVNEGDTFFSTPEGPWLSLKANGEFEIGEPGA